jgi:hypothetical protein
LSQGVLVKRFAVFAALLFDLSDVHGSKISKDKDNNNRTPLQMKINLKNTPKSPHTQLLIRKITKSSQNLASWVKTNQLMKKLLE